MTATRVGVFALMAMVALARPMSARQRELTLGQWVRVVSPADSAIHKGRLILVLADTVVLDDGHRMSQRTDFIHLDGSARVEFPRRIRSHPLEGAFLGAALGIAVGGLSYTARSMFTCASTDCSGPPTGQLLGLTGRIVLGGLIGVAIGTLVGAHIYTTLWDPVPPDQMDRLRVGVVSPQTTRLDLGASLRF
jgi:hypothetical protein